MDIFYISEKACAETNSRENFKIENDHSPNQKLSFLGKAAQNRLVVLRPMFSEKEGRVDFSFIFNFFYWIPY